MLFNNLISFGQTDKTGSTMNWNLPALMQSNGGVDAASKWYKDESLTLKPFPETYDNPHSK